jgi:hypothetical protein
MKNGTTLFNGKADSTPVEDNGRLSSIMSGRWVLNIQYEQAGSSKCANGGTIAGTLSGRAVRYSGCANPSDWDLISLKGAFDAYYRRR